jgi:Ca2+/H+ antiporter
LFPKFSFWHYLLLLIPVTVIVNNYHFPAVITFILASTVLVPLAHFLGEATEVISKKTGIINAAFGNAAELVIAILAIKSGLIDIVKYSLIGSIIGNILLILGRVSRSCLSISLLPLPHIFYNLKNSTSQPLLLYGVCSYPCKTTKNLP